MIIGNILGIKPIVTISAEGTVDVVGKALGQRKALKVVNDFFRAEKPDPAYPILYLYSKVDDAGRKLIEQTGGDPATAEFYNLLRGRRAHRHQRGRSGVRLVGGVDGPAADLPRAVPAHSCRCHRPAVLLPQGLFWGYDQHNYDYK